MPLVRYFSTVIMSDSCDSSGCPVPRQRRAVGALSVRTTQFVADRNTRAS